MYCIVLIINIIYCENKCSGFAEHIYIYIYIYIIIIIIIIILV